MEKKKYYSNAERKSFGRGFFTGIKKAKHPTKRLVYKKKKPMSSNKEVKKSDDPELMVLAVSHANFLRDKYKLSSHDHASNLQLIKADLEENPTFRESLRRKYIEGRKDWKYNSSTNKFGK